VDKFWCLPGGGLGCDTLYSSFFYYFWGLDDTRRHVNNFFRVGLVRMFCTCLAASSLLSHLLLHILLSAYLLLRPASFFLLRSAFGIFWPDYHTLMLLGWTLLSSALGFNMTFMIITTFSVSMDVRELCEAESTFAAC
jgi:hypothetical protein